MFTLLRKLGVELAHEAVITALADLITHFVLFKLLEHFTALLI